MLVSGVLQSDSVIHIYNTLHLLITNSQSTPLPLYSPLATTSQFSMVVGLFLFHRSIDLYQVLDSKHISDLVSGKGLLPGS